MSDLALLILALALSIDSAAVAASAGLASAPAQRASLWRLPPIFALGQGVLCALGHALASVLRGRIEAYDHWIAFGLLALLGVRLWRQGGAPPEALRRQLSLGALLMLSLATGVDALVAGMGLALLEVELWRGACAVSLVTLGLCAPAVWLAGRLGTRFAQRAERLGGVVLIAIGFGLVAEHTGLW
jgi:putative Mn2+ efflux pump MntP